MIQHIAFIPDGNRHWAVAHGLPKVAGYPQSLKVIERCCYWAIDNKIPYISFYCYSTENFERRPRDEFNNFIELLTKYYHEHLNDYINAGIRVVFNGRKDRLPAEIITIVEDTEQKTLNGTNLTLVMCIDYGGRHEIVQAIEAGAKTEEEISAFMQRNAPDPEIIVRTNNMRRLSNFMLWQASYSELFFLPQCFPDVTIEDLNEILNEYYQREKYYGGS